MAPKYKTSLSVGADIREMLLRDDDVTTITKLVYPVFREAATLPYIVYRREALEPKTTKTGYRAADTVTMYIECYAKDYAQSIALAEAARHALEKPQPQVGVVRGCSLTDSSEVVAGDAVLQILIFKILS